LDGRSGELIKTAKMLKQEISRILIFHDQPKVLHSQSVKTAESGGIREFDAHKRVKGRKRHILIDTCGLLIACRVEPADISDRRAASLLLGGLCRVALY